MLNKDQRWKEFGGHATIPRGQRHCTIFSIFTSYKFCSVLPEKASPDSSASLCLLLPEKMLLRNSPRFGAYIHYLPN